MKIDGSYGEGGGQILRTSLSLSCITGEEVEITNIRKGRKNPGLRTQHLKGVLLLKKLCNAKVEGARIGSTKIKFTPQRIKGGVYKVDIGTAGSITLILQISLLPSIFADRTTILKISGGTDVPFAPPVDYYRFVLIPFLKRMGAEMKLKIIERGYYPEGGGKVEVEIEPSKLMGLRLEDRGELKDMQGYLNLRNLPFHIAERMCTTLSGIPIERDASNSGISRGCGLLLLARYRNTILSGNELCKRGVPAERIAQNALEKLYKEINSEATVDVHMADHLITFASAAYGETHYFVREVTDHTKTNAWVVEKFGAKVEIKENSVRIQAYM